MNRESIEQLLRQAPRVSPPKDLLTKLKRDITLPSAGAARQVEPGIDFGSWIRRWLPAAGFAAWFLGCVVVLGYQASRINEITRQQASMNERLEAERDSGSGSGPESARGSAELERSQRNLSELQRLRAEVEQLRQEVAGLTALRSENARLRAELKALAPTSMKPEEDFFAAQQQKASRVLCINHIKQLGLAARMEANDRNSDVLTKEMNTLKPYLGPAEKEKLLLCSDGRTPYQLLSPGASLADPSMVFVRCQIHNNAGLVDGSAHQLSPEHRLVNTGNGVRLER